MSSATTLRTTKLPQPNADGTITKAVLFLSQGTNNVGSVGIIDRIEDSEVGHKQFSISAINLIDSGTPLEKISGITISNAMTAGAKAMKIVREGDNFRAEVASEHPDIETLVDVFEKGEHVSFNKQDDGTYTLTKIDKELVDFSL